jgi:hypothetical protein
MIMRVNKKNKKSFFTINRFKTVLFCLLLTTLILSCTGDLDNGGAALVGPSSGITIIPQAPQILKQGTQTFTATGGVAPYTYSLSSNAIGTIVPATGVFTGVQALAAAAAGTAIVTAVDSTGVSGTTTVTVLPTILIATPGSGIITEVAGTLAVTATLLTGSALVTCSVTRDDSTTSTALPTPAVVENVCTTTASAVPASGTETYTITITDSVGGDYASVVLTLGTP